VKVQNFTSTEVELPPSLNSNLPTTNNILSETSLPRGSVSYREAQSLPDSSQMNLRHSVPYRKSHQPRTHPGYRTGDNSAVAMPNRGLNPVYRTNEFQSVMSPIETPDCEEFSDMEDTNLPTYSQWEQYMQPTKTYQINLSQSQQHYRSSLYPMTVNNSKQQMNQAQSVPHQKQSESQPISRMNYNYNYNQ